MRGVLEEWIRNLTSEQLTYPPHSVLWGIPPPLTSMGGPPHAASLLSSLSELNCTNFLSNNNG